ncbi:Protein trigalactosyldiacylglycerol 2, chloroplastic [Vitis vinifera]|uniref:Protein trigalactosyldiacylglycerol 2, chloroplastic n=1 Tax=Vitis vinifera TaxID=29760 RepID=A0A438CBX2_VITVI|nr:Protein trigalactosyldiacylglycerol 2, chloroplastic [Vitis vinifera]
MALSSYCHVGSVMGDCLVIATRVGKGILSEPGTAQIGMMFQIKAMAEDVQPLVTEFRDTGLLKEVESLTKSLAQATEELRRVHSSILTPENTELIQKSIYTLIFTLKNIENISSDILGFTGDEATRRNLKLLIKSLSRLL